jgi:hypothetical protein|tara:strand:- start:1828 stop:2088 length:261 start_codon:yes stop_codon:yes gene_type:complete
MIIFDLFNNEHLYKVLFEGYKVIPSSFAIREVIGETDDLRLSNVETPETFYEHLRSIGGLRQPDIDLSLYIPNEIPNLSYTSPAAG